MHERNKQLGRKQVTRLLEKRKPHRQQGKVRRQREESRSHTGVSAIMKP